MQDDTPPANKAPGITWLKAAIVFSFWIGLTFAAGLCCFNLSGAFVSLGNDVPRTTQLIIGFVGIVGRFPWATLLLVAACFAVPCLMFRNRDGIRLGRQFGIAFAIALAVVGGFTIFGILPTLSSQDIVK